jgi:hypothetical protein
VQISICQFRGIGRHYHVLMQESGDAGRSYAGKFDSRMAAETWVLRMAREHFPLRTHKLVHGTREGPWFYRSADDV